MKIGFIGLGHLGKTMAARLLDQGNELVVWNRTAAKADGLNAEVAPDPAGVAGRAEVIFLNLFDSAAVSSVLDAVLGEDCAGKIIIDTTTNHFAEVMDFHVQAARAGAAYLEAPVLGSVVPASQGNLTVLVSGDKQAYERALPQLQTIGRNIFFLGAAGLASKMKLINNLVLGSLMAALAEAIAFAEAAGIGREDAVSMLLAGAGNSGVLNAKKDKLISEDFSPQFSGALIYKDLQYLQDLAFSMKRPLFTGSIAKELYGMTFSRKIQDQDFSAIYSIMKQL